MPQTQSVKCAGQTKKYLKPDAVPSIFDFPKHLKTQLRIENLQQREKSQVKKKPFLKRNQSIPHSQICKTAVTAHHLPRLSHE